MPRASALDQIRRLDPVVDHQRIILLSARVDFPFDTTRALEFALFRTYCVPSISALLDQTGEFARRPQKRYDDTDILVSELMEHGYDSGRGRLALQRMNRIHGHYDITNDDFLYVLSTFVFEPIRWNARFGWRPMIDAERLAYFHFWRAVGRLMIIRDIPDTYDAFEAFNRDYERRHFRFSESNRRIGEATRNLFASWFPRPLAPFVRASITAMLDEPLLLAFGFDPPPRLLRAMLPPALRLRGRLLRFLPGRRRPQLRTEGNHASYPGGYQLDRVGPPGLD